MLETKCVGINFKMLVTVLAILVTNIHYLFTLASGTNIQKMSPTSLSPSILITTWMKTDVLKFSKSPIVKIVTTIFKNVDAQFHYIGDFFYAKNRSPTSHIGYDHFNLVTNNLSPNCLQYLSATSIHPYHLREDQN